MRKALLVWAMTLAGATAFAAEEAAEKAAEKADPAVARLEALKPKLWSKEKADREKTCEAYLAEGDAGRKQLAADLLAIRTAAIAACREIGLTDATQKKLLTAHKKLSEARKEALRVIFDKKIYPDEDHGRVGQPIVDKAVDVVKAAHPLYRRAFDPFVRRLDRVLRAYDRIKEIDVWLEKLEAKDVELNPPLDKVLNCDPELVKILQEEAAFVAQCEKVLRYNRTLRTTATTDEKKVTEVTNEYRMQLGFTPLAISEPLTQAARKHSQEMQRLGYFAHDFPTPENRDPGKRCANEGYNHYRGENIASGAGAEGVFKMWYNSSGHHRNMLGGHNEIGVGLSGSWTEDFGSRSDLDLDNPPRTLPKTTPPPAKEAPKKK